MIQKQITFFFKHSYYIIIWNTLYYTITVSNISTAVCFPYLPYTVQWCHWLIRWEHFVFANKMLPLSNPMGRNPARWRPIKPCTKGSPSQGMLNVLSVNITWVYKERLCQQLSMLNQVNFASGMRLSILVCIYSFGIQHDSDFTKISKYFVWVFVPYLYYYMQYT